MNKNAVLLPWFSVMMFRGNIHPGLNNHIFCPIQNSSIKEAVFNLSSENFVKAEHFSR